MPPPETWGGSYCLDGWLLGSPSSPHPTPVSSHSLRSSTFSPFLSPNLSCLPSWSLAHCCSPLAGWLLTYPSIHCFCPKASLSPPICGGGTFDFLLFLPGDVFSDLNFPSYPSKPRIVLSPTYMYLHVTELVTLFMSIFFLKTEVPAPLCYCSKSHSNSCFRDNDNLSPRMLCSAHLVTLCS